MKKLNPISSVVCLFVLFVICLIPTHPAVAQNVVKVQCGDIVPGEFTEPRTFTYAITVNTGDMVEFFVQPADDYLVTAVSLSNSNGGVLGYTGRSQTPKFTSGRLSRGIYYINVGEPGDTVGEYELWIGCTLADGTPVPPGSVAPESSESSSSPAAKNDTTTNSESTISATETQSSLQPLVEVGKSYEFEYGTKTKVMKVLDLRADGWIKVEHNEKWSWLNLTHVIMITPVEE